MKNGKILKRLFSLTSALALASSMTVMPAYAAETNMTLGFYTTVGNKAYKNGVDDKGKPAYTISSAINVKETVTNEDGTEATVIVPGTPTKSNELYSEYAIGIHSKAFSAGFYKFKAKVKANSGIGTVVITNTIAEKAKTIAAYVDTGSYKGFVSNPYLETGLKDSIFKSVVENGAGNWQYLESPLIYISEDIVKSDDTRNRLYIGFINETATETVDVSSAGTYESIDPVITGLPDRISLPAEGIKTEELKASMTVDGIEMTAFGAYATETNKVYSRNIAGLSYTLKEAPEGVLLDGSSLTIPADTDYHATVVIGVSYDGREIMTHSIQLAPGKDIAPVISGLYVGGTPYVGNTLSAKYEYYDENGDEESGSEYVWYRDNDVIEGASEKKYVLTEADKDKQISVTVTPKNNGENGVGESLTSKKTENVKDGNVIACGDIESNISGVIGTSSNANGDWSLIEVVNDEKQSYSGNKSLKITKGPAAIKDSNKYFTAVKISSGLITPDNDKNTYKSNFYRVTAKIKGAVDDYALINAYDGRIYHYSNVTDKYKYFVQISRDYASNDVMQYIFSDVTEAENGWKNVEALLCVTEPKINLDIRIGLKEGTDPVYIDDITVEKVEPVISGNNQLDERFVLNGEEKVYTLEPETISIGNLTMPTVTKDDIPAQADSGIGAWAYGQINLTKSAPSSYSFKVQCPKGVTYDADTKTITVAANAQPGTISIYSLYRGGAYALRTITLVNKFVFTAGLQDNGTLNVHEENNSGAEFDRTIVTARYNKDSNSLKDLIVLSKEDKSAVDNNKDYTYTFTDYMAGELVKVFMWDSMTGMVPVMNPISQIIQPAADAE